MKSDFIKRLSGKMNKILNKEKQTQWTNNFKTKIFN
jgi:hypothetical protein